MKTLLKKLGHAIVAVVHDKAVQRTGKQLGALLAVRLLIALGCSAEVISVVEKLVG